MCVNHIYATSLPYRYNSMIYNYKYVIEATSAHLILQQSTYAMLISEVIKATLQSIEFLETILLYTNKTKLRERECVGQVLVVVCATYC